MRSRRLDIRQWIAARAAPAMFWLSLVFLVCTAIMVVLWVDVPNMRARSGSLPEPEAIAASIATDREHRPEDLETFFALATPAREIESAALLLMCLVWPIVMLESVIHMLTRPWKRDMLKHHAFGLFCCLVPPVRMCARSPEMHDRLWLPGLGWRKADARLRRRLQRQFSIPMICIALLIMPVLIVEFFMKEQVAQHLWLRILLHIGTGVIWFSFAAEFILMVSVADRKLKYCKQHWIDLAIILLPLISFLRSLQTLRATRLAKVMKIQQLSQIARVYRLRGTTLKMLRALVVLELFRRVMRISPDRTIAKLKIQLEDVEAEAKRLRRRIALLEREKRELTRSLEAESPSGSILDQDDADLPVEERVVTADASSSIE